LLVREAVVSTVGRFIYDAKEKLLFENASEECAARRKAIT
jgi:hypothetical protein